MGLAWIAQRVAANSAGSESSCDPILSGGVALFGLLFFTGSVSRVLPGRLWKEWPYAPWTSLGVGSTLLLLAWLLYVGSCLYPEGSS
jgi:hypothetical protein